MAETNNQRFTKYFPLLLDALRSSHPTAMRPREAVAWIKARTNVPADDLTRVVKTGKQSIFENDVQWVRYYLVQAGLISNLKRGLWGLTPEGNDTHLTPEEARALYVHIRDANRSSAANNEADTPAPDVADDNDEAAPADKPLEKEHTYTLDDIIKDGCFLTYDELEGIYRRWISKNNLILQGPPGTGKTWLAQRLGFACVGSKNRETTRSRLRVIQFHPSLTYEDFVRGWRPNADGRLSLVDGTLMQVIEAAINEPDSPFVLVIEEINRGNPAQIFGEMLTLLENTKRGRSEAIELAYRKDTHELVHIPENLFIIGTMNVADRSLAIVDFALRRRFAFVDLTPRLGPAWRKWCIERGFSDNELTEIETRIATLNNIITDTASLGPQYQIGHSFVTPNKMVDDRISWFQDKVETEIGPLLDEYWYDAPDRARAERMKLLAPLA